MSNIIYVVVSYRRITFYIKISYNIINSIQVYNVMYIYYAANLTFL